MALIINNTKKPRYQIFFLTLYTMGTGVMAQKYVGLSFSSPNMETGRALNLQKSAASTNQEGISTLIQSGCYIGFLPDHSAHIMVDEGAMQKIDNPKFTYHCEFTAIHRKSPKPTRLVNEFLDSLEKTKRIITR